MRMTLDTSFIMEILQFIWVPIVGVMRYTHTRITNLEDRVATNKELAITKQELRDNIVEIKDMHRDLITEVRGLRAELVSVIKDVYPGKIRTKPDSLL